MTIIANHTDTTHFATHAVAERVAQGAALLDIKQPGWEHRIDLDTLDIQTSTTCVLGQVFCGEDDPYEYGADYLLLHDAVENPDAPVMVAHGFDAPDSLHDPDVEATPWTDLTAEWRRVILQRRAPEPLLTAHDVLDIQCALQNAAAADTTTLNAADRQSLALLTYDRQTCKSMPAMLIERILDGTYTLPVDERRSHLLLRLIDRLPAVSDADVDAWLAARDVDTPCVADQIITALAGYAASRIGEPGCDLLVGALQTVLRVAKPGLPLDEVPATAGALLGSTLDQLDADGLIPPRRELATERALHIMAARAARHCDTTGEAIRWCMRTLTAEIGHDDPSPITDEEQYDAGVTANRLIERVQRAQMAAEYGEQAVAVAL